MRRIGASGSAAGLWPVRRIPLGDQRRAERRLFGSLKRRLQRRFGRPAAPPRRPIGSALDSGSGATMTAIGRRRFRDGDFGRLHLGDDHRNRADRPRPFRARSCRASRRHGRRRLRRQAIGSAARPPSQPCRPLRAVDVDGLAIGQRSIGSQRHALPRRLRHHLGGFRRCDGCFGQHRRALTAASESSRPAVSTAPPERRAFHPTEPAGLRPTRLRCGLRRSGRGLAVVKLASCRSMRSNARSSGSGRRCDLVRSRPRWR